MLVFHEVVFAEGVYTLFTQVLALPVCVPITFVLDVLCVSICVLFNAIGLRWYVYYIKFSNIMYICIYVVCMYNHNTGC